MGWQSVAKWELCWPPPRGGMGWRVQVSGVIGAEYNRRIDLDSAARSSWENTMQDANRQLFMTNTGETIFTALLAK